MHSSSGATESARRGSRVKNTLASGDLPARKITARVVGAATPTTVVAGVVPAGIGVIADNRFPVAFLVIAVLFELFCVGFLAAARRFPPDEASGAFYTIIRHGLGRIPGVGAAWVAVPAYAALTVGLYGLIGSVVTPLLSDGFGVDMPWQAVAVAAVLLVGWAGVVTIEAGTRLLMVLVTLEIVMIVVVSIANLTHPAPGGYSLTPFDPAGMPAGAAAAVLALGVLGYVGTELTVVHTQDSRDGHRGVTRATYATVAILTVVYVAGSFGLSVTFGGDPLIAAAAANPGGVFVATAQTHLGTVAAVIVRVLFATSVLAGAISFHGATSRYCFVLGRDRTAPAILGRAGRKYGSPFVASLTQTVLALAAIVTVSVAGADPVLVLFYVGGTAGAVGILLLLTLTALATATMAFRHGGAGSGRRAGVVVAAVASTVLLTALVTTVLIRLDTLLGVPPDSDLPGVVRAAYGVLFLAGALWAVVLRVRAPADYDSIAVTTIRNTGDLLTGSGL